MVAISGSSSHLADLLAFASPLIDKFICRIQIDSASASVGVAFSAVLAALLSRVLCVAAGCLELIFMVNRPSPDVRLGARYALESQEAVLRLSDLFDYGLLYGISTELVPLLLAVQARLQGLRCLDRVASPDLGRRHAARDTSFRFP